MHNKYSAVLLLSATAEFKSGSDVLFYKNTGHNGGAIAMIGFSVLLLNPHSLLHFSSNTAIRDGGAIYHSTNDRPASTHFCEAAKTALSETQAL